MGNHRNPRLREALMPFWLWIIIIVLAVIGLLAVLRGRA
jgi:hypothetical protein